MYILITMCCAILIILRIVWYCTMLITLIILRNSTWFVLLIIRFFGVYTDFPLKSGPALQLVAITA